MTILMYAAGRCGADILEYLINNNADIYEKDNRGTSVLQYAVVGGNIESVKYLVRISKDDDDKKKSRRVAEELGFDEISVLFGKKRQKIQKDIVGEWGDPYYYIVDYEDIATALKKLRNKVFKSGRYYGAEYEPESIKEALCNMYEEGTKSILDIDRISDVPESGAAAPLNSGEMEEYFGTDRPTIEMISNSSEFWGDMQRGHARYIIIFEDDVPCRIFFAGYPYD
jgi:hypothetical protein